MQIGTQQNIKTSYDRSGAHLELMSEFSYTFRWLALAPSAVASPAQQTLQNDADFLWLSTSWFCDVGGGAASISTLEVPLVAVSYLLVNEPFQASEAPLTNLASAPTRERYPLLMPFWLPGGSTFKINSRNFGDAVNGNTYDLWVTLHGLKYKKVS